MAFKAEGGCEKVENQFYSRMRDTLPECHNQCEDGLGTAGSLSYDSGIDPTIVPKRDTYVKPTC